jgi:hypothetical protein
MQFEVPCDWAKSRRPAPQIDKKRVDTAAIQVVNEPTMSLGPLLPVPSIIVKKASSGVRGRILKQLEVLPPASARRR